MKKENREGYITIATNKQKYLEIALNLSLSIKLNDKKRPIALMYDKNIKIPEEYKKHFNHLIQIKNKDLLKGNMNKLLLFKYSPFEKTMFIDADCLLIKKDMNTIWKKLKKYNFTVMGEKIYEGDYWSMDIKKLRDILKIPYLIKFVGDIMFFDKSKTSENVFKKIFEYYRKNKIILGSPFRGTYNDETWVSAAMGYFKLEPFPLVFRYYFKKMQWIECFTGKIIEIDPFGGRIKMDYGAGHFESPTIAHFPGIGYKPRFESKYLKVYIKLSNELRENFGVVNLKNTVF